MSEALAPATDATNTGQLAPPIITTEFAVGVAETDYATIEEAVAACTNGIILIRPGTYLSTVTITLDNRVTDWHIYAYGATISYYFVLNPGVNYHFYGGTYIGNYDAEIDNSYMFSVGELMAPSTYLSMQDLTIIANVNMAMCVLHTTVADFRDCTVYLDSIGIMIGESCSVDVSTTTFTRTSDANFGFTIFPFLDGSTINVQTCRFSSDAFIGSYGSFFGVTINIYNSILSSVYACCPINIYNSTVYTLSSLSVDNYTVKLDGCTSTTLGASSIGMLIIKNCNAPAAVLTSIITLIISNTNITDSCTITGSSDVRIFGCVMGGTNIVSTNTSINNSKFLYDTTLYSDRLIADSNTYNALLVGKIPDVTCIATISNSVCSNLVYADSGIAHFLNCHIGHMICANSLSNNSVVILGCEFTLGDSNAPAGFVPDVNNYSTSSLIGSCSCKTDGAYLVHIPDGLVGGTTRVFRCVANTSTTNEIIRHECVSAGFYIMRHAENATNAGPGYFGAPGTIDDTSIVTGF